MQGFGSEVRRSIRSLSKARAFSLIAVLSIGLGIGANTLIFSAVNSVLLKALPFHEPETLALVWGKSTGEGSLDFRNQVSATDIADVRGQNTVFEDVSTFTGWMPLLSGSGEAERVPAIQVGDGYFRVMRGTPLFGRTFTPEDQQEGKDYVVVLSHGLWKRRFGGDPSIIGKTVLLNHRVYTIVGVMPSDFRPLPDNLVTPRGELYRPVAEAYDNTQRDARHLRAIARLKDGVSLRQAREQLNAIGLRIEKANPQTNHGDGFHVVPLTEDTVGPVRPTLLLLLGAVAFVLLIACANVGNLMIVRASAQQKELTIRAALGASRGRIVSQLLLESSLIAVAGGFLGLALAWIGAQSITTIATQVNPVLENISIDFRVLLFTLIISISAGLLCGVAPAFYLSRIQLSESLKDSSRSTSAGTATSRLRSTLVIAEIAITLMMLTGAALLIQTVMKLQQIHPGFVSRNLLTMTIALPTKKYPEQQDWIRFYRQMIQEIQGKSGVESAAMTSVLPMSKNFDGRGLVVEERPAPRGQEISVDLYVVTPDYLRTMQIALKQGRSLSEHDHEKSMLVALINKTMADQFWPNQSPIGKRIRLTGDTQPWRTIVGVVNDVRQYGLDLEIPKQIYLPHAQFPTLFNSIVVKTKSDPVSVFGAVRQAILSLDKDQAVYQVSTMEELISRSLALRKVLMMLLIGFAGLALVLAAVGIYGVISYIVTQRTQEFGIRLALGAQTRDMLFLVLRYGMALAGVGLAIGITGTLGISRLLSSFLYGVGSTDPSTLSFMALALGVIALLACLLPAARASRVDPIIALKSE